MEFACPTCRQALQAPDRRPNPLVRCPICRSEFRTAKALPLSAALPARTPPSATPARSPFGAAPGASPGGSPGAPAVPRPSVPQRPPVTTASPPNPWGKPKPSNGWGGLFKLLMIGLLVFGTRCIPKILDEIKNVAPPAPPAPVEPFRPFPVPGPPPPEAPPEAPFGFPPVNPEQFPPQDSPFPAGGPGDPSGPGLRGAGAGDDARPGG